MNGNRRNRLNSLLSLSSICKLCLSLLFLPVSSSLKSSHSLSFLLPGCWTSAGPSDVQEAVWTTHTLELDGCSLALTSKKKIKKKIGQCKNISNICLNEENQSWTVSTGWWLKCWEILQRPIRTAGTSLYFFRPQAQSFLLQSAWQPHLSASRRCHQFDRVAAAFVHLKKLHLDADHTDAEQPASITSVWHWEPEGVGWHEVREKRHKSGTWASLLTFGDAALIVVVWGLPL